MFDLNMYVATVLGLGFLVYFGDMLVHGATQLSRHFKVSDVFIGVVVIGLGTSLPEILTAVIAALGGVGGLAVGNVVGSNIANVFLILGVALLLFGRRDLGFNHAHTDYATMLLATAVLVGVAWVWGFVGFWHSCAFLALLALILYKLMHQGRQNFEIDPDDACVNTSIFFALGKTVLALVGLWLGADLLVDGASNIAAAFGVPPAIIGLSFVALGTSLPELAATLASYRARNGHMILGNIIGSNMLNILAALGFSGLFIPLDFGQVSFSLTVMVIASVALLPLFVKPKLASRSVGGLFIAAYVFYIAYIYALNAPL